MIEPGLCGRCRHARTVTNRRGSTFYRCGRSARDDRFPRYPALPVLRCPGFATGTTDRAGPGGQGAAGRQGPDEEAPPDGDLPA